MRRRRVTYRPSKAQGAFGVAVGAIFVVIGLVMVIPVFGLFGVLWTLVAVGITAMNAYQAFGKNYTGPQITIEEDEAAPPWGLPLPCSRDPRSHFFYCPGCEGAAAAAQGPERGRAAQPGGVR